MKVSLYGTHLVKHGHKDGAGLNLATGIKGDVFDIIMSPQYANQAKIFHGAMTGFTSVRNAPLLLWFARYVMSVCIIHRMLTTVNIHSL
jgi:hypothetical protein